MLNRTRNCLALFAAIALSTACSNLSPRVQTLERKVSADTQYHMEKAANAVPVITSTTAYWLAGMPVQVAPPVLPVLTQDVGYHPTRAVSLADIASWITQHFGLVIDIAELQSNNTAMVGGSPPAGMGGGPGPMQAQPLPTGPLLTGLMPGSPMGAQGQQQTAAAMFVNFDGPLSGLLDVAANKSNAWWKVIDGRVSFYRTETKTFYLPVIARKFTSDSTIATSSSAGGGGGGASAGPAMMSAVTTSGSTSTGGENSISNFSVDMWGDLDKTAKVVGAGAQISTNQSAGSITVTGTPAQVRHVEEWARGVREQLSQQVAISVHVYSVKVTSEDNYNWDPSVIFKAASGIANVALAGPQAPSVVSGTTPFNLGVSVLSNALSGRTTQYSGSQLAFQALSTLGRVTEQIKQTVVTMHGQPAPMQIANQQGFLQSSATTSTANVGSTTTLTPGTLVTGFTAMFLPRIVDGKVILGVTMTNSTSNGFSNISSGGATIQNPNFDKNSFQQSVSLTPGDALLLTGLQRDTGSSNKSGIGGPDNYLFGGGVDTNLGKQVVAIVITARIL